MTSLVPGSFEASFCRNVCGSSLAAASSPPSPASSSARMLAAVSVPNVTSPASAVAAAASTSHAQQRGAKFAEFEWTKNDIRGGVGVDDGRRRGH